MAAAIISGLVATEFQSAKSQIYVSEPWDVNRDKIAGLGVRTTTSNAEAAADATILILAVKPQVAKVVCEELAASWASSKSKGELPLLVSICAGIPVESLTKWCTTSDGRTPVVVRVMPNTPALLGEGASGVFAGQGVSSEQRAQVTALLGSVSKSTEWVEKEELIEVVTGVSGELAFTSKFQSPRERMHDNLFCRNHDYILTFAPPPFFSFFFFSFSFFFFQIYSPPF